MIDLEDAKVRVGIAIGKGVETGSKENVLGNAVGDGAGERIFGIAASGDEKSAKRNRERLLQFGGGLVEFGKVLLTEDGDGDGIVENEWRRVIELVRGAAQSHTKSSPRGASGFHERVFRPF